MAQGNFTFVIPANGQRKATVSPTNYIYIFSSTANDSVTLTLTAPDGNQDTFTGLSSGIGFEVNFEFDTVIMTDVSGLENTVAWTTTRAIDNRTVGEVNVTGGIIEAGPTGGGFAQYDVTTALEIVPALASRARATIRPIDGTIFVAHGTGASGVTSADGMPVHEGESYDIATTQAVYAIAETGSVDVRVITHNV